MKEKKERERKIVLAEHPVFVGDKGILNIPFEAKRDGKVSIVFTYIDEVDLFTIGEFTFTE